MKDIKSIIKKNLLEHLSDKADDDNFSVAIWRHEWDWLTQKPCVIFERNANEPSDFCGKKEVIEAFDNLKDRFNIPFEDIDTIYIGRLTNNIHIIGGYKRYRPEEGMLSCNIYKRKKWLI